MNPLEENDLHRRLREGLEPGEESVRRVVRHAMAAGTRRRHRAAPVLLALGICIAGWLFYLGLPKGSSEVYTLSCVGEVAVVQAPDGSSWVFSAQEQDPGPATESGFILFEGDIP